MNLLITSGATREPIDDVRFVSNVSTGATGAALADAFAAAGHQVTLLRGVGAVLARQVPEQGEFTSAADLQDQLRRRLQEGRFSAVVMTAAVSDYRPDQVAPGKLSSTPDRLTLTLTRNPKILPQLKSFCPRALAVVGFKLTSGATPPQQRAAVEAQFAGGGVDAVVQNDLAEIRLVTREQHPFRLYREAHGEGVPVAGTTALAAALLRLLQDRAPQPRHP